jgi:hypothetical protein
MLTFCFSISKLVSLIKILQLDVVVHAYNPNYSGSGDFEDWGSRLTWEKS